MWLLAIKNRKKKIVFCHSNFQHPLVTKHISHCNSKNFTCNYSKSVGWFNQTNWSALYLGDTIWLFLNKKICDRQLNDICLSNWNGKYFVRTAACHLNVINKETLWVWSIYFSWYLQSICWSSNRPLRKKAIPVLCLTFWESQGVTGVRGPWGVLRSNLKEYMDISCLP